MIAVSIATDIGASVTLGVLAFTGASVVERDERIDAPLRATLERLMAEPNAVPEVALVRQMYHRLGIDPTRTRPSSEALLRRIRRGDPFPRVNSLVDLCNWCSIEVQLPYGLYDLDRIGGSVTLRRGADGEAYPGIRKEAVHVAGRPVLADALGPFGNPTSDSARTMVTTATTRALFVIYAPKTLAGDRVAHVLDLTSARVRRFSGAAEDFRGTF